MKRVGVLALQGAVSEHLAMLSATGMKGFPVRHPKDLDSLDALILPGGESTVMSRLMDQKNLRAPIKTFAKEKAIMGTCAGLILCAETVLASGNIRYGEELGETSPNKVEPLGFMPIGVSRNGFGRQRDSFETLLKVEGMEESIPAVFIRAPYIEHADSSVQILARVEGKSVMARYKKCMVTAFHPELTDDYRIADFFCRMI